MAVLAGEGWPCVMRSAGSLGPIDVWAFGESGLLAVQVKCGTGRYERERARLAALPLPPDGRAEVWVYVPRQGFRRLPATEAAS